MIKKNKTEKASIFVLKSTDEALKNLKDFETYYKRKKHITSGARYLIFSLF